MSITTKRKFWIDTDAGCDDAHAILMALSYPDVEVVGFSTVFGNTTAAQSAKNVLRILKTVGKLDIPVHVGVERSLIGTTGDASYFHGKDGMGDVPDPAPADVKLIQEEDGIRALIRALRDDPGAVSVIALGPLTNLALALRLEPEVGALMSHCHIMGGNYAGEGNVTASAEFNFHCDPEAAHVVLSELTCPITLTAWETCLKMGQKWEFYHRIVETGSPSATLVHDIFQHSIKNYYTQTSLYDDPRNTNFEPADQVTVAAALDPTSISSMKRRHVKVELTGVDTRGLMIVDWRKRFFSGGQAINLVLELDQEKFRNLISDCLAKR